tara:strand:- start:495 stop:1112 length:618 start_codon:yes stop_codon:yes gene_type:complete
MSDIEEDSAVIETINDSIEVDGTPTRDLQKVKKPRSEKQIEALKKAQVKRAENIEKRKAEKEVVKKLTKKEKLKQELKELEELEESVIVNEEDLDCNSVGKSNKLIEQNEELLRKLALSKPQKVKKPLKPKKPIKQTIVYESDSSDTEEEQIIVKKKKKKQKKSKKKVVYESSSESESEEEYLEPEPAPAPLVRQKLRYGDVFRF